MQIDELISFLFPILSVPCSLVALYHNHRNWKHYIFLLALFLGVVAYCYTPTEGPDLLTYFDWIEKVSVMSIKEAWNYNYAGKVGLNLFNLICWLIGKIGDYHLLPAISSFLVYYISFYITCDTADRNGIPFKYATRYIIFSLFALNFYAITNNVRNILAFALGGLAVYRDICQNKRNFFTFFLYVFPIFLHSSAIVVLLVRLIILIPGNYKYIFAILSAFVFEFTDALYSLTININLPTVVKSFIRSAYFYYRNSDGAWAKTVAASTSQRILKIINIFVVAVMCLIILLYVYERKVKTRDNKFSKSANMRYLDFCFYIGLITIACAPMPMPEYWRFAAFFFVIGGSFFVLLYSSCFSNLKVSSYLMFPIISVTTIIWIKMLLISEISPLLYGPVIMNLLTIFFKDFINLFIH